MKKLLILPLLLLLTGCVTYYTPEVEVEDGVYYADEDPAYINNAYVSGSYMYAGAAYYPWRSLDYFYLGYRPYGFSLWYYPYYSYYAPWYRPYPYYGHHHGYKRGRPSHDYGSGGRHDRYAGNNQSNPTDRRNRRGEDENRNEDPGNRRNRNRKGGYGTSPVRRYVSTAPSGYSGNRGMVIRSREDTKKSGKHRVDPAKTVPVAVTGPTASNANVTQPVYRSRQDGREIRYSSGAKQGKSRVEPVRSASPYRGVSATTISPATAVVPVQRSRDSQAVNRGTTTRHVSGKSRSDKSSRSSTRSGNTVPVSHSSRSHSTSAGSSSRASSRSNSGQSRRRN